VLFCCYLCCSMSYFSQMCTVLLPPGDNPIAVTKYIISYNIIYHITSHHTTPHITRITQHATRTPHTQHTTHHTPYSTHTTHNTPHTTRHTSHIISYHISSSFNHQYSYDTESRFWVRKARTQIRTSVTKYLIPQMFE
jgi:hypothetical protein